MNTLPWHIVAVGQAPGEAALGAELAHKAVARGHKVVAWGHGPNAASALGPSGAEFRSVADPAALPARLSQELGGALVFCTSDREIHAFARSGILEPVHGSASPAAIARRLRALLDRGRGAPDEQDGAAEMVARIEADIQA